MAREVIGSKTKTVGVGNGRERAFILTLPVERIDEPKPLGDTERPDVAARSLKQLALNLHDDMAGQEGIELLGRSLRVEDRNGEELKAH